MAFFTTLPLVWRVGLAVAWLVGSWLFGPKQKKNSIFDPGAQEMPRWNTALRGLIIPVAFGTNRISSQVIWQHNYNVVRKESGTGGGKIGGSGGGKGGAQTGSISYEYYWDLIFHLAMVPEKYELIKGWMGSQRINNDAMAAIIGGAAGSFVFTDVNDANQTNDNKVTMSFEDSFWFSGSGPAFADDSDVQYDGWDNLTTAEGIQIRWPHTCYVGFKQLDLGQYPAVPQLSFEIGPGESTSSFTPALDDSVYMHGGQGIGSETVLYRYYDKLFCMDRIYNSQTELRMYQVDTTTGVRTLLSSKTTTDMLAETIAVGGANLVGRTSFSILNGFLDPWPYFLTYGLSTGGTDYLYWDLWVVNYDGTFECVSSIRITMSGSIHDVMYHIGTRGITGLRTKDDAIIIQYNGDVFICNKVYILPSINQFYSYNGQWFNSTIGLLNQIDLYPTGTDDYFGAALTDWLIAGSYRKQQGYFFILPKVDGLGGIVTRLYFWVGRAECQYYADNPANSYTPQIIKDNVGTYPNGFLGYFEFSNLAFTIIAPGTTVGSPTIDSTLMKAHGSTTNYIPMTLYYADGTTEDTKGYGEYSPHPVTKKFTDGPNAGGYLCIFGATVPNANVDLYAGQTTYSLLQRFFAAFYSPTDGTFDVISSGQFQVATRAEIFTSILAESRDSLSIIDYDFQTKQIFAFINQFIPGAGSGGDAVHYFGIAGELALSGGSDVLPPYIIREILTNSVFGVGLTTAQIDDASYQAALDYCTANDFYVSVQYRREDSVLQVIDDLLSTYGGFLMISNGLVKFKQLEYLDGLVSPVRTIDNHHLVRDNPDTPPVRVTKGARQDTFNKIRVNYFDRNLEYAQNQVEEGDEVDQDLNGTRMREFPAIFVMDERMARTMAVRALWANLYERDTYEFKLGWKDQDLEPGDVITLVDSYHSQLSNGTVARIIEWKEEARGLFSITAKQELEYILASSASPLDITSASIINYLKDIPTIRDFTMYELPTEFNGDKNYTYVAWSTYDFAYAANLWLSTDNITFANAKRVEPYQITGLLLGGLPADSIVNENVEFILSPRTDWFATNSLYFNQTLSDVDQSARAAGASMIWCGSELMEYEGVNLVGQNHYRMDRVFRGVGATNKHAHNSGDVWYKHGGGLFYQELPNDKIGSKIYYKVQPLNISGMGVDISSITSKQYTFQGENAAQPLQGSIQFNGGRGKTNVYVGSTIDITVTWPPATRAGNYGSKGYGFGGYGYPSVDSQYWDVIVRNPAAAVVHSATVTTPAFTLTSSQNFDMNGAWTGRLNFEVKAGNNTREGIFSSVTCLNLWT